MKKIIPLLYIIIFLIIGNTSNCFSQSVRVGIKVAPVIAYNRAEFSPADDSLDIASEGAYFSAFPSFVIHFGITDVYHIVSGITYAPKTIHFSLNPKNKYTNLKEEYTLQYIQIPLLFKMNTPDLLPGFRAYAQLGALFDIHIHLKPKDDKNYFIQKVNPIDIGLSFGAGVEKDILHQLVIFAGIYYNRGMLNAVSEAKQKNLIIKNDFISLDIGIKF